MPGGAHYDETDNFHAFDPGTQHEYSNVGSALIGFLVAEISGLDFNEYCKQNIFQPLGMDSTERAEESAEDPGPLHPQRGEDFTRRDVEDS